jgi:hypothetical protein
MVFRSESSLRDNLVVSGRGLTNSLLRQSSVRETGMDLSPVVLQLCENSSEGSS